MAADPLMTGLAQAGVLGCVVAVLFWRDWKKDEKLEKLIDSMNNNSAATTEAIHHLTRSIVLEVLTRPNVVQRAKDEASEIQDAVGRQ